VLATKKLAAAFIFTLLLSAAAGLANLATATPDADTLPIIAMPEEYINYTISRVNGTLWAKIDGTYPLHILTESDGAPSCVPPELPMVYPTPPGTTNIHVKIDETELNWSNYTEAYPSALHHTAIGDWPMIYCLITPVSEYFVLKIHYEHPVQQINGSNLFLYDLNISPYLSPWSPNSTAHFTIRMETNTSNLQAYTTETDSVWNPINYTTSQEGATEVVAIQMRSEYSKPLLGDLVIMFSDAEAETAEVTLWIIIPLLVIAALVAFIIYRRKHRRSSRAELK
jgi:hypothetical protein